MEENKKKSGEKESNKEKNGEKAYSNANSCQRTLEDSVQERKWLPHKVG